MGNKRLTGGMLAIAICTAAHANDPAPTFQPQDVFALRFAADPQVRPDGKQVAYVRNGFDIMTDGENREIWLVDLGSGQETPLLAGAGRSWRRAGRRTARGWPMLPQSTAKNPSFMCAGWRPAQRPLTNLDQN